MRVEAQGRAHNGKKFKEVCETVVVNAHGGLLMLKHEIDNGEMIVLMNPETLEEQECRVVYQGEPCEKGQRIGVEFLTPAPRFWGLEFGELSMADAGSSPASRKVKKRELFGLSDFPPPNHWRQPARFLRPFGWRGRGG
jgi:hypothetical protein